MPDNVTPTPRLKILVTGAAGFIAARVCALLHEQGHEVSGLDNFNDAYDVRLKVWRWVQLENLTGVELHRLDLTDAGALERLFEKHARADALGAFRRRGESRRARGRADVGGESAGVCGIECAGRAQRDGAVPQVRREEFVLASTSSLYGKEHTTPYREEMNTDRQLSPYAASKKAAEAMAYTYHFLHKLDVSILRYFTVYGPAGRPDMTPLRFVQRIREGRKITIFGDGTQSRDFTYVDDIARGTISALRPVGCETFNLGSDEPLKLSELIRLIEELTYQKAQIEYKPWHPADMAETWADISKARKVLEWTAQTGIREGMAKLVKWYEENRDWAKDIQTD